MRSKVGLLIGLIALIATSSVASEPRGLIVFTEPPSTYVQTLEFTSYVRSNVAYSTIVRTNGQREHVTNSGIMGIIDYPPAQISATDETQATAAIQQIQQLQRQCQRPDLAPKFQLALTRWQTVLSAIRSVAKPPADQSARTRVHNPATKAALPLSSACRTAVRTPSR